MISQILEMYLYVMTNIFLNSYEVRAYVTESGADNHVARKKEGSLLSEKLLSNMNSRLKPKFIEDI